MPAKIPQISQTLEGDLRILGQSLRDHRKKLGISAVVTAEAAELSRVTLYRIECGEPSVTMGAYLSVISCLGLKLDLSERPAQKRKRAAFALRELPKRIKPADYSQLKKLAWQIRGDKAISPKEALNIYERNWRHLDIKALGSRERKFLELLLECYGRERLLV